jgi:hypothetical protein
VAEREKTEQFDPEAITCAPMGENLPRQVLLTSPPILEIKNRTKNK